MCSVFEVEGVEKWKRVGQECERSEWVATGNEPGVAFADVGENSEEDTGMMTVFDLQKKKPTCEQ